MPAVQLEGALCEPISVMYQKTFVETRGRHRDIFAIRRLCNGCRVLEQCLDHNIVLEQKPTGAVAGLTLPELNGIRAQSPLNAKAKRVVLSTIRSGKADYIEADKLPK